MNIGIDLGGTNVRAGLVDRRGRVVRRASCPTVPERGVAAVVEDIAALCLRAAGSRWGAVKACGIGAPGPLDRRRTRIEFAPNLDGWRNVPLARLLRRRTRKAVRLENDANCAAYGEYVAGAGRSAESLVMYTLGTGVGGGIVLDGSVWTGASGGAGELGHMIVEPRGRRCPCGRRGCLEAYASATALTKRYRALTGKAADAKRIFSSRDRAARKVVAEAVDALAVGVVNIVHALHPERVVIGGGVARAGGALMAPLRRNVMERVFPTFGKSLRIVRAALGNDAGIVGSAMLAERHAD